MAESTQKNQAFYKIISGEAKLDCVYLFYNGAESDSKTIEDDVTPSAIFSDITKYGGVLRILHATPTTVAGGVGMGVLASSDNGESYGEEFKDGSKVYAAAVVVSGAKKEDDVIFCVNKFDTPITKAANAAVIVNAKVVLA